MNHCVPDFETDDDYLFPAASSSLKRHRKSAMGDDDIMELLWQNGQVVMHSQNQRSNKRSETMPSSSAVNRDLRSSGIGEESMPCGNLFMQEDEMVSWLHYPNDDNSLDLYGMYPIIPPSSSPPVTASLPPPPPLVTAPPPRPPIPPLKRVEEEIPSQPKFANFSHFSRPNKGVGGGGLTGGVPSMLTKLSPEKTLSTVVESNDRSAGEALQSRVSRMSSFGGCETSREPETGDLSGSLSPGTGGSGESASVEPSKPPSAADDRKRKGRENTEDTECYSEELEFESHDLKKKSRGSTSTKRSRAAEVHNLSERRRRDRINEKMKALQELIPRCNKSDKASMLDEAIEYLKSLQMQVQMMSMGYNMVPMMFPGVQRYMPAMAAMGMGMGMDQTGMNRTMVPFPQVFPGPTLTNPAAHLGQRFPVPRFQMAQVPTMGPTRVEAVNPSDPMMNSFPVLNANQPRVVPFANPYQQCVGLPQTQLPQHQNPMSMAGVPSKPSSSKDVRNSQRHPTG